MKIKTTISAEKEIDVKLPKFWRNIEKGFSVSIKYIGAINELTCILITELENYTSLQNGSADTFKSDIAKAIADKWEEIPEETFLSYHETTLDDLSLLPKEVIGDPDDLGNLKLFNGGHSSLNEIDQEIENELNRNA